MRFYFKFADDDGLAEILIDFLIKFSNGFFSLLVDVGRSNEREWAFVSKSRFTSISSAVSNTRPAIGTCAVRKLPHEL